MLPPLSERIKMPKHDKTNVLQNKPPTRVELAMAIRRAFDLAQPPAHGTDQWVEWAATLGAVHGHLRSWIFRLDAAALGTEYALSVTPAKPADPAPLPSDRDKTSTGQRDPDVAVSAAHAMATLHLRDDKPMTVGGSDVCITCAAHVDRIIELEGEVQRWRAERVADNAEIELLRDTIRAGTITNDEIAAVLDGWIVAEQARREGS
jgi:hypothetical protein